jgi:hypothetical protein
MLLQSEHRTLDPEEADFFYLPVRQAAYTACMYCLPSAKLLPFSAAGSNCQCRQRQRLPQLQQSLTCVSPAASTAQVYASCFLFPILGGPVTC